MSMSLTSGDDDDLMAEMNTTPLIDVMLVLLIMLIITVPMQIHAVKLDMPAPGAPASAAEPPPVVTVGIDFDGTLLWDGETVPGLDVLDARIAVLAAQPIQPEFHVRPHKLASYGVVAAVMSRAHRHGLSRIGIVGSEQFIE